MFDYFVQLSHVVSYAGQYPKEGFPDVVKHWAITTAFWSFS
jgi:hypothetical protein